VNTKAGLLLILVVFFQVVQAQSFKLIIAENGEAALWRASSGQKEQIKNSVEIGIGDTLVTLANADALIWLEGRSTLLIKGGSVIVLHGEKSSIDISLEDGQIFLDRNQPHELTSLRILTKGYSFTPTGTAAAFKTTRQGVPTVAVLRGSIQMRSPHGGSISVEIKQFGTVNSAGLLVSGSLNEKGLEQLGAWSGVKAQSVEDESTQEQDTSGVDGEMSIAEYDTLGAEDLQTHNEEGTLKKVPKKKVAMATALLLISAALFGLVAR